MTQQEIQPTYVTYNQAVWLKEKGFDIHCDYFYVTPKSKIFGIDEHNRYYPRKNISKKLHKIGDCAVVNIDHLIQAPEQWLVIEWLRLNHGIEVVVIPDSSSQSQLLLRKYTYSIFTPINGSNLHCQIGRDKDKNIVYFLNPHNAYSAAFDYIISNNLI